MTLTASDVDHEDHILYARTLHKTFLYGIVVEPARFSDSASSHIQFKTAECSWIFFHPFEEGSTERVIESRLRRINWVLECMLVQAWYQFYNGRNLDIKTSVDYQQCCQTFSGERLTGT